MPPFSASPPPGGDRIRRKATLICSVCDHESPPDGDWRLDDDPSGTAYDCPDCGNTITVRRSFGDADGDDADEDRRSGKPTARFVSTPIRLWADYVAAVNRAAANWATSS